MCILDLGVWCKCRIRNAIRWIRSIFYKPTCYWNKLWSANELIWDLLRLKCLTSSQFNNSAESKLSSAVDLMWFYNIFAY